MSIFKSQMRDKSFLLALVVMTFKMLLICLLLVAVAGTGLLVGVAKAWVETAPELDLTAFDKQAKTSFIYDKYGSLITDFKGTENRIDAKYSELPENLINAVIAIEDQRFYSHNGVDVKRIIGALVSNLSDSTAQGGSTITQQLIKQTMLSTDQNYKRKLQEAYLALHLEDEMGKEEIITEYLNVIYLGGSNYGVKVAAQDYFGKDLSELTLRECATLAGIIRDPYKYHPRLNYYIRQTPHVTNDRAERVLTQMLRQELITQEEYDEAMADSLVVMEKSAYTSELYDNAYYVEYAIYDVVTKMLRMNELEDTTANRSSMETKLRNGGYHIYTSLDPQMQEAIQAVVTNYDKYPKMRNSKDQVSKASLGNGEYLQLQQPQAAAAVVDWSTGELLAIIGGRNTPVQRKQLNRAAGMGSNSGMPVGSSIKPLSVYGPALDMGNSPGSPVINAPLKINGWRTSTGATGYPRNYEGGQFTGMESIRTAMNKSHNTAAAQALYTYVGIENSVTYLQWLGVSRKYINETGAGLALGSSGIPAIEMAAAYGAIANEGMYLEPYAFTKVMNSDGSVYMDIQSLQVRRQAFKPSTAGMLVDVLKGCVQSGVGTGSKANFGNFTVAGKTGTNSDWRGVTFGGMTGYMAACVWIGHDDYKPLEKSATGGESAAPLWAKIMSKAHEVKGITTNRDIITKSPSELGLIKAEACGVSGMKPTAACYNDANGYGTTYDYYLEGTEPTENCNMHRSVKLCTKSMKSPSSRCRSVKTYGSIYIPEGHPLRASTLSEIREYFNGASSDKYFASLGTCDKCGGGSSSSESDDLELENYKQRAETLITRANELLETVNLTSKQKESVQTAISRLESAVESGSLSNIKKYGSQLQSLVNKAEGL